MLKISIYSYQCPRQFLLDTFATMQQRKPKYSLRQWARTMGLPSHALLSLLMQGKRPLRPEHVSFLSKGCHLDPNERLYMQALIEFRRAKTSQEKSHFAQWLSELKPQDNESVAGTEEINEIMFYSAWEHTAILALLELSIVPATRTGGIEDLASFAYEYFGKKTTLANIRSALVRLKSMKLVKQDASGHWHPQMKNVKSKNDVPNPGVRKYHQCYSELAKQAVDEFAVDAREFQSMSLTLSPDQLVLAKKLIRQFREKLLESLDLMKSEERQQNAKAVYQLNLQLFPLKNNHK